MRLTIARKIGGMSVILIAFIIGILIHSVFVLRDIESELVELAVYDVPLSEIATGLEIKQLEQHIFMEQLFSLYLTKEKKDSELNEMTQRAKTYSKSIKNHIQQGFSLFRKGMNSPKISNSSKRKFTGIKQELIALNEKHEEFDSQFWHTVELITPNKDINNNKLNLLIRKDTALDKQVIQLVEALESFTKKRAYYTEKHEQEFFKVNLILGISAVMLGIILSTIVTIGIKTKILRLSKGAEEVTEAIIRNKSLPSTAMNINANDEFALLSQNLSRLVNHFSQNINQKVELSRQLEMIATTDKLTGAFNRYKWDQILNKEMYHMQRKDYDLSLIMLDIDFFKSINDRFGHDVGDMVLAKLAELVGRQIRQLDSFFRLGGEEFAVLLTYTNLHRAIVVANKLRTSIEIFQFGSVPSVTISLGVTQFKESDSLSEFIKRADRALYLAKNSGRNCVKTI